MTNRTLVSVLLLTLVLTGCTAEPGSPSPPAPPATAPVGAGGPTGQVARVCDHTDPGPATAPPGAITVDPAIDGDLAAKTRANPPGTTFWLAPGTHTLGRDEFGQVAPKDRDSYLGAPGAILDGRGLNRYAFTEEAQNVAIRHLTIRSFVPPQDQGVVNHDSGNGWVIESDTIEGNKGAGLMAGAHQQVRHNCLRNNGQYGMNAYQAGNAIVGLVVEQNEVVGNNTDDWERQVPGCGCTGGIKFWSVNVADVRSNWIHDNRGPGLWADTNNNDFLVEDNLLEGNDGEAVLYETSYNLVLRGNVIRNNTLVKGRKFAEDNRSFPVGTIYLSEAGGEPRISARTDKIDIYDNLLENNWSGITAWENADRFCNSPANTSTGYCTRLVESVAECAEPAIDRKPLYDDCRWKTQRVAVHDNTFHFDPAVVGCAGGGISRMAVLSNYGTYPDWSPYPATIIQHAITFEQGNQWRNNSYIGPWQFMAFDMSRSLATAQWQAGQYKQDAGSTFSKNPYRGC